MTLRATIDEGLTTALREYGRARGLPALRWGLCSSTEISVVGRPQLAGMASMADFSEGAAWEAVRGWAAALGFELVEQQRGTVEARGVVDEIDVEVWGVVDLDAFEQPPADVERS